MRVEKKAKQQHNPRGRRLGRKKREAMKKRPNVVAAATCDARPKKRPRPSARPRTDDGAKQARRGHETDHKPADTIDSTTLTIDTLPDEILAHILGFVSCLARHGNAAAVCRRWRAVALDPTAATRLVCFSQSSRDPCAEAAAALHADCVDEALRLAWPPSGAGCEHAARAGRVDLIERFRTRGFPFDPDRVAIAAAGAGHLDVLRDLCQRGLLAGARPRVIDAAAAGGHIACIEFARSAGLPWDSTACTVAARHGHLACLCYLHENGCPWSHEATRAAVGYDPAKNPYSASEGHVDCLRYLHEHGCYWAWHTCEIAAQGGAVECLLYALDHDCPYEDSDLGVAAVYSADNDILATLQARGHPWDAEAIATAAEWGWWDIIEILRAYGCPWDERVCKALASHGDLDLLRRAHAGGCPWDPAKCLEEAIRSGHVDIVRWLCEGPFGDGGGYTLVHKHCALAVYSDHRDVLACLTEHRCPWHPDEIAEMLRYFSNDCLDHVMEHGMIAGVSARHGAGLCTVAARWGRVDVLRRFYAAGYRGDTEATDVAARHGHIECIEWLVGRGCPIGQYAVARAAGNGHLNCVAYLCESGAVWGDAYVDAAAAGHVHCLAYMDARGHRPVSRVTEIAASHGRLDVLRYLHEGGRAWDTNVCTAAAREGHLACLRYAHRHGAPIDLARCRDRALANGHYACARYLAHCARSCDPASSAAAPGSPE